MLLLVFNFVYVSMSVCGYRHVSVGIYGVQKRVLDYLLELELQVVVSPNMGAANSSGKSSKCP